MMSGMLTYLAVFSGGETTLLFDQIGLLPHDVDHFRVFHPLFGSEAFEIECFLGSCQVSFIGPVIQHTIQLPAS